MDRDLQPAAVSMCLLQRFSLTVMCPGLYHLLLMNITIPPPFFFVVFDCIPLDQMVNTTSAARGLKAHCLLNEVNFPL